MEKCTESLVCLQRIADAIRDAEQGNVELFLVSLFSSFFGAAAAFVFAIWKSKLDERSVHLSALARSLVDEITVIEGFCENYWSRIATSFESGEDLRLATSIKTRFPFISSLVDELEKISPNTPDSQVAIRDVRKFCSEGFDVATGDKFESPERESSPEKITRVFQLGSTSRLALLKIC